jgi:hypothetical protein
MRLDFEAATSSFTVAELGICCLLGCACAARDEGIANRLAASTAMALMSAGDKPHFHFELTCRRAIHAARYVAHRPSEVSSTLLSHGG